MKNVIKAITLGAIVFVICYLLVAFIKMDMNVSNWDQINRATLAICFLYLYYVSIKKTL